ncbi:protein of unknown function [Methylacidimicrobium sp. AP8]|nr:protein of unknown function [Methylacidimicrobium sp. AP8]
MPAPLPSPPPAARAESAPSAAPGLSGPSIPPGTGTPSPLGEAAGFARGFAQGAGDELKDTATTLRRLPTVAYEVATDARYRQQVGKAVAARARAAAEFAKTALTHPDEAARRIASAAGQAWQSFLDDYQREGAAALGRALGHAVVFVATTIIPGGGEAAAAAKAVKAFEAIQAFEKAGDLENAVALLKAARAAGLEDKLAQEAKLAFIKAGCPRGYVDIFAIEFSKDYHWARPETLYRHSVEHEKDFGATGPASYARMAQEFLRRAQAEGLPTKIDSEGVIRIYDPATATFGVYNADGTTATFFKPYGGEPKKAQAYFDRQPGNSPNLLGGP